MCETNPVEIRSGRNKKFLKTCQSCRKWPHTAWKGWICEACGFIPKHRCQLDLDHMDGNPKNNDPSNFVTLCANCHRLRTYMHRQASNKRWKK